MSENKDIKTQEANSVAPAQGEPEVVLLPAVDIYEDDSGFTLLADLPGVSRDRLNIQVDGNDLTIEAEAAIEMPENMDALYADIASTRYRRRFTLSNELATDQISAEMKDGVLTLKMPKRAELQPRKIEIRAG